MLAFLTINAYANSTPKTLWTMEGEILVERH